MAFALAGLVRSNGILLAGFFAYDGLVALYGARRGPAAAQAAIIARTAILGAITVSGFAWTHWDAYRTYCPPTGPGRPWCGSAVPMLYSFVQDHYWCATYD